jgi:hypothetical protein
MSLLVRTHNNLAWAVVFNHRPAQSDQFLAELDAGLWQASSQVTSWPTHDLFSPTQDAITVVVPGSGGQEVYNGDVWNVQWTYTGDIGSAVKVDLLRDGVFQQAFPGTYPSGSNGTGGFNVGAVQMPAGSGYQVRVTSVSKPTVIGLSSKFWISNRPAWISASAPQQVYIGDLWSVEWTYFGSGR